MTELVRPYRGISASDRQAERRARLLDACLTVVGRDGIAATTVASVCDEAGLTKRYFYESFADLDTILVDVLDRLHSSLQDDILLALSATPRDPLQRARITIGLLVDQMNDRRMGRLYVEADGHARLHELRQAAYATYAQLVLSDVLAVERPTAIDQLDALVYVTGITQAVVSWLRGTIDLTREALIDRLAGLAVSGRN